MNCKKVLFLFTILISFNTYSQVSFDEFQELKVALKQAFKELGPAQDTLVVNQVMEGMPNYWWGLDVVYASYAATEYSTYKQHNIFLFGGFARLPGMTLDGLALTACHEIGHGIGGAPFKISGTSTEGQSDYFASKVCLPIVFKYLEDRKIRTQNNYVHNLCEKFTGLHSDCLRLFSAIEADIIFFRYLGTETSFSTRATEEAQGINRTDSFYPTAQCRLDTMSNGALGLERPLCWFPKK